MDVLSLVALVFSILAVRPGMSTAVYDDGSVGYVQDVDSTSYVLTDYAWSIQYQEFVPVHVLACDAYESVTYCTDVQIGQPFPESVITYRVYDDGSIQAGYDPYHSGTIMDDYAPYHDEVIAQAAYTTP